MYRDRDNNVIGASHLSPIDSVIATLGNKCMRRRLGTESRTQLLSDISIWLSTINSGEGIMMDVGRIG
jgi:hypothetical protein